MKTRRSTSVLTLSVLTAAGVACGVARAATLSVPTQFSSIQAAIDAASDGDEILLAPGLYPEQLTIQQIRLTIRGTGPTPESVTIGAPGGPTILRVFGSPLLRLEGLTLSGGVGQRFQTCRSSGAITIFAGAVLGDSSAIELDRCVVSNNTADQGGAFFLSGGSLTIRRSTLSGNGTAPSPGSTASVGAVIRTCDSSAPATILIEDSVVSGNGDASGGLDNISPFNSTLVVRRTRFENNRGAVIQPSGLTNVTVEDSTFVGNSGVRAAITIALADENAVVRVSGSRFESNTGSTASSILAAMPAGQSSFTVTDTDFIGDSGQPMVITLQEGGTATIDRCEVRGGEGGGIFVYGDGSTADIRNTLIVGAAGDGVLFSSVTNPTTLSIDNCTIVGNANIGVRTDALLTGTLNIRNSIITGNAAAQIGAPLIPIGQTIAVSNSIIQGGYPGTAIAAVDPRFVSPSGVNGDYSLRIDSPAIDAGDNAFLPSGPDPLRDVAGNPRRVDIASVADTGLGPAPVVDLGAYERPAAAAPTCPADFNNAGGVTVQDIFDFLGAWFASDARADFNNAGGITVQDIFDFLTAWFAPGPNC